MFLFFSPVVSYVKIDNVLSVGSLNGNREGVCWMKRESDQPSCRRGCRSAGCACINSKSQKTWIPCIKPWIERKNQFPAKTWFYVVPNGVFATRFWPFHHRNPFIIIAKKRQIQIRWATIGLCTYGQLCQQSFCSLSFAPKFGAHYRLFESKMCPQ